MAVLAGIRAWRVGRWVLVRLGVAGEAVVGALKTP